MGKQNQSTEDLRWYQKLRVKYKLTIRRQDTYEERIAFQISRMNVIIFTGVFAIILILVTSLFIAYTPLKEYIPGQTELETRQQLYTLQQRTDSIETALYHKDLYLSNVRNILSGGEMADKEQALQADSVDYNEIELKYSREDSLLREHFEQRGDYELSGFQPTAMPSYASDYSQAVPMSFFKPISGYVTNRFDASINHFGLDIVPDNDKTVKATLSGTVVFSGWTVETGNVISIQHTQNLISVYKHNASLLKEQGSHVEVGEPIAISGESGELSSGPHLHFELWMNGTPIDPEKYILF